MRTWKRTRWSAGLLAALALALTACGSNNEGDGSSGGPMPTGSVYKFGVAAALTGALSTSNAIDEAAATAWQDWTNQHGGINGHKVEVIVQDTGSDPSKARSVVRQLIENDHVLALIGADSSVEAAIHEYVASTKTAFISTNPLYPWWDETPTFFRIGIGGPNPNKVALLDVLKNNGSTSVGVVACAEVPSCQQSAAVVRDLAPKMGLTFGGDLTISQATPNYTAQCLSLKEKNVQGIVLATLSSQISKLTSDCAAQGYYPMYAIASQAFDPVLAKLPKDVTALGVEGVMPWFVDDASTADYRSAMKSSGAYDEANMASIAVWTALVVAGEASAELGDNPTPASFIAGMATLKDYTAGGLMPPTTYPAGEGTPITTCYYVGSVKNGTFATPLGTKPTCYDASSSGGS